MWIFQPPLCVALRLQLYPGHLDLNRAEARLDLDFSSGVSRAALSISLLLEQEREKAGLGAAAPVSREHWGVGNMGGRVCRARAVH